MIDYKRKGTRFNTTASGGYSYQVWKTNHYAFGHYVGGCWITKYSGMYSANSKGFRDTANLWGTILTGYTLSEWMELVAISDTLKFTLHIDELQVYFLDNNEQKIVVKSNATGREQVQEALKRLATMRGKELPKSKEETKAAKRTAAIAKTQKLMANPELATELNARNPSILPLSKSLKTLPIKVAPELKHGLDVREVADYRAWFSKNHSKLIGVKMINAITMYRENISTASETKVDIAPSVAEPISKQVAKVATKQPTIVSNVEHSCEAQGANHIQHSNSPHELRASLSDTDKALLNSVSKAPIANPVTAKPKNIVANKLSEKKKTLIVSRRKALATIVANNRETEAKQLGKLVTVTSVANESYSNTSEARAGLPPEKVFTFRIRANSLRQTFKTVPLTVQIEEFLVGRKTEDCEIVLNGKPKYIAEPIILHDTHIFAYRRNRAKRLKALRSVTVREGHGRFRMSVLANHDGCSITGLKDCVEAAHIVPVAIMEDMRPGNGLALVSWLHAAFDALAFSIDPIELIIHVAPQARQWLNIDGLRLVDGKIWPLDRSALAHHFERFKETGICI
ncbi:HNH endonuclease [Proteus mirabilis]|nr:HNH endonuclease [Proteus mirabilis]